MTSVMKKHEITLHEINRQIPSTLQGQCTFLLEYAQTRKYSY